MLVRDMDPSTLDAVADEMARISRSMFERSRQSWARDPTDIAYWRGMGEAYGRMANRWRRRAALCRRKNGLPPRCPGCQLVSCIDCSLLDQEDELWPVPEPWDEQPTRPDTPTARRGR